MLKEKGLPIEIMFHGYRGSGERDLSTGVRRAFLCNHNALIVDQRAASKSDGNVISFGINEHRDCIAWANFVAYNFGEETKINNKYYSVLLRGERLDPWFHPY